MATVFWDRKGVLLANFIPMGSTMNSITPGQHISPCSQQDVSHYRIWMGGGWSPSWVPMSPQRLSSFSVLKKTWVGRHLQIMKKFRKTFSHSLGGRWVVGKSREYRNLFSGCKKSSSMKAITLRNSWMSKHKD